MSYNQAPKSFWSTLPPEILLKIISEMDHLSRINVAVANPENFLRSSFNIFEQDAWSQVKRRKNAPFVETRETWPLLYTAIENDFGVEIIARMLKIYVSACPSSIDGVWCEGLTALPPPIVFAAGLGKPFVVSLLLDEGADPLRRGSARKASFVSRTSFALQPEFPGPCVLQGFNHAQCEPFEGDFDKKCTTVLRAAAARAVQIDVPGSIKHREAEECVLILHRKGLVPPSEDKFIDSIRPQFDRLVKAIGDRLIITWNGTSNAIARLLLHSALHEACIYQRQDNNRTIIEYLVSIGAPLIHPTSGNRDGFTSTGVCHLLNRGHVQTATFLLNRYADQGVLLDYSPLEFSIVSSEHVLPCIKAFYRLMGQPNQSYEGMPASSEYLQGLLLKKAMQAFSTPAIRWLVEQGVGSGSSEHIHYAISIGNKPALYALVEAGHTDINGMVDLYAAKRSALERALLRREFEIAIFLINKGGDPTLLGEETKTMLLVEYAREFPTIPYVESRKMLTPAMLRPEFFTVNDLPRRMAMFHYVIG